jgi:choline-sulfatase
VSRHGAWDNSVGADRFGPSHVRNIRNAGYHTALIGKTHLMTDTAGLRDWGYEYTDEIHSTQATTRSRNSWVAHLAERGLLDAYSEATLEYARVNWSYTRMPWREPPAPIPTADHVDNFVGRKAAEWIERCSNDRPFYLQVLFPGPHPPFNSAPEYRALYRPENMPIGILESPQPPIPPYVDFVMRWSAPLKEMTPRQMQLLRTFYYAKITMIDERIGDIVAALRKRGILDNTWIVYSSDHGENLGDHRLNQKIVFYESALKVPCIIRPPRGTTGWQSNALVDHLDIVTTLLEVAKAVPLPDSGGRSLVSKIADGANVAGANTGKEAIISEVIGYSMVYDGRYKLAADAATGQQVEFLDTREDPRELTNRVEEASTVGIREELASKHLRPLLERANRGKLDALVERRNRRDGSGMRG